MASSNHICSIECGPSDILARSVANSAQYTQLQCGRNPRSVLQNVYQFVSSFALSTASARLLSSGDRNVTAVVGSSVTFICETNAPSPACWKYAHNSTASHAKLYDGIEVHPDFTDRYHVDFHNASRRSNLTIKSVQVADDGLYVCYDCDEQTEEAYWRLTVFGELDTNLRSLFS